MMTMIPKAVFQTSLGRLYEGDCLEILSKVPDESVDLTFADPPFNLGKLYASKINDAIKEEKYIEWCKAWASEMIRVLAPGGSLFIYNLPRWNLAIGSFLMERLTFRHWITVDMKYSLPIQGRLYPANYSLLYFCKGKKPRAFHPDRLPLKTCRHCGGELQDYGGYKDKMNPHGVNLSDVWTDIDVMVVFESGHGDQALRDWLPIAKTGVRLYAVWMKISFGLLVGFAILGAVGCSSSSHVVVGRARPPISPDDVRLYLHPPTKYEEVALLDASSKNSWAVTDQGKTDKVIERLKKQAAALGANGVLISGLSNQSAGSVSVGSATANSYGHTATAFGTGFSAPIMLKEASGMAIFVIQE